MRSLPLVVIAAFVAACRFGYDGAALDDGGVADGQVVVDAADVVDVALPASDAEPQAGCDPSAALVDDFGARLPDARWLVTSAKGGQAVPTNGRLRITLPDPSAPLTSAGYTTLDAYDLTGARLSIQVPTMVDTVGHTQVFFQLFDTAPDPQHIVAFEQQHGRLQMYVKDPGALAETSIAYDPVEQRYWQLREADGTLYFETSPDGATWSTRFESAASFDVTHVVLQILVGTYQDESAPGFAEFDDLGGTVCKRP